MNSLYDKQTKGLIVLLLVAFGLIIGGSINGYKEIEELREKVNQQEMSNESIPQQGTQTTEGKGDNTTPSATIRSNGLVPVTGQRQQWPDLGIGHCLLVVVEPPHNEPDDLTNENTIKVPIRLCESFLMSMMELEDIGFINKEDLIFKKSY